MAACKYRAVFTTLPGSKRWRLTSNDARVLWLHALLRSDAHGALEIDDALWADQLFPGDPAWDTEEVRRCRQELECVGLVDRYLADDGITEWAQIRDHDDYQTAEYKRKRAPRTGPELSDMQVQCPSAGVRPALGAPRSRREVEVEEKKKREDRPTGQVSKTASGEALSTPPPKAAREVFAHWKTAFHRSAACKLDDKRRRRIAWAVNTYGLAAALRCIDGYVKDPWEERKRRCDLTLLFRDAAHFEAGLAFLDEPDGGYGDVKGTVVS